MRPLTRLLPAAVLTAVIAAPAAAAAPWSAPVTISSPHTFAGPVSFAGQGLLAPLAWWRWQDGIGSGLQTGASFTTLPRGGAFAPELAVPAAELDNLVDVQGSSDGRLLALSQTPVQGAARNGATVYRITTAAGSPAGFGAPRTLARGSVVSLARLAIASAGRGGVAYITYEPRTKRRIVHVAVRSVTGAFAAPQVISGRGQADQVSIAADRKGDLVVAFERDKQILARVKRAGHGWGSLQTLAKAVGPTQWTLRTAVGDGGNATVLWRRRVLRTAVKPGRRALEAVRLAIGAGRFGKVKTIEADDVAGTPSALTLAPEGGVAVGYTVQPNVPGAEATPRVAVLGSHSGTVYDVAPASGGVRDVRVAYSVQYGLFATMTQPLPDGDSDGIGLGAFLAPGAAEFGPLEAVTPAENVHEIAPGFGADGTPVAVWSARPEGTGPGIPIANIHSLVRAAARTI